MMVGIGAFRFVIRFDVMMCDWARDIGEKVNCMDG